MTWSAGAIRSLRQPGQRRSVVSGSGGSGMGSARVRPGRSTSTTALTRPHAPHRPGSMRRSSMTCSDCWVTSTSAGMARVRVAMHATHKGRSVMSVAIRTARSPARSSSRGSSREIGGSKPEPQAAYPRSPALQLPDREPPKVEVERIQPGHAARMLKLHLGLAVVAPMGCAHTAQSSPIPAPAQLRSGRGMERTIVDRGLDSGAQVSLVHFDRAESDGVPAECTASIFGPRGRWVGCRTVGATTPDDRRRRSVERSQNSFGPHASHRYTVQTPDGSPRRGPRARISALRHCGHIRAHPLCHDRAPSRRRGPRKMDQRPPGAEEVTPGQSPRPHLGRVGAAPRAPRPRSIKGEQNVERGPLAFQDDVPPGASLVGGDERVYHDDDVCPVGQRIPAVRRNEGKGKIEALPHVRGALGAAYA